MFAEYPDARVIHTHRDPRKFIASLVSLLAVLRFMRSDRVDVAALGPDDGAHVPDVPRAGDRRSASDGTIPDDRIVDSHFLDLMADPVAALHKLYEQLELDWPAGHDRVVPTTSRPSRRASTARTRTRSPTSGSTRTTCARRSPRYVAHYGITEE